MKLFKNPDVQKQTMKIHKSSATLSQLLPGTGLDHFFPYLWQQSSLMGILSPLPVTPGDQRDQVILCKVTAVLSSNRDMH